MAVVGSTTFHKSSVTNSLVRGRLYPWGLVEGTHIII